MATNCVSNGAYCAFDPSHFSTATGRDVILESIRQKCIYKINIVDFFAYMRGFYLKCFDSFSENCSKSVVDENWIDWTQVQKCVVNSFHPTQKTAFLNENDLLADEKENIKNLGTNNFPNIFINNIIYKGTLSRFDLLFSICSALHDDVHECRNIGMFPYDDIAFWQLVLIQLTVFVVGTGFLAVICRKYAKRQYMQFAY